MGDVNVTVSRNGPYLIQGPFTLQDAQGSAWTLPEGKVIALCRCGQSATKPFCDGTHNKVGFDSAPTPDSQPYPYA